jgi:hypothetical protein
LKAIEIIESDRNKREKKIYITKSNKNKMQKYKMTPMTNSSIKVEIVEQLEHLPYELQRQVLDFARALSRPKGVLGKQLLHFAGTIKSDDLQAMSEAIEAECERVDVNEW